MRKTQPYCGHLNASWTQLPGQRVFSQDAQVSSVMAALAKIPSFSSKSWENRESEEDETHTGTVLDVFQGKMAEVCWAACKC